MARMHAPPGSCGMGTLEPSVYRGIPMNETTRHEKHLPATRGHTPHFGRRRTSDFEVSAFSSISSRTSDSSSSIPPTRATSIPVWDRRGRRPFPDLKAIHSSRMIVNWSLRFRFSLLAILRNLAYTVLSILSPNNLLFFFSDVKRPQ